MIKIYDTMSRDLREFVPIEDGKVKMYVCGPTVYNYIHVGNARSTVSFDTIRRYFEYRGYEVAYISNFTDVDDKIILPSSALRDEGTSYHYAPASDEIAYDETLLLTIEEALNKSDIEHFRTKAWTTDAFYRETADKVKRRLAAGATVVDMEASAIMAWAQFRQAKVYQFFYTADYVDHHNHEWDARYEERKADAMTFFEIALVIARDLD